jgi:hypothetical protein
VQVDGLYLSAGVALERQKSERLAVTLAVSLLSLVNAAPGGHQTIGLV